ncbi:aspartyl protease family protein [Sphingobacterium pedocola]|uniref:Clan AA aspartic protease n=1 Tax=Sphingobacterium pedocola TaxID=2082722 RepID=A0ABR9T4J1_9SPHI|nr:aspartyl protease family protein [Sphingobacterium pedocola]MBE8720271.1 clan AA aspartic protease [Sphingobacterium pedocola]
MQIIPLIALNLEGDGIHIIIEVEIFDKPFKMVVDTGASKTVLDKTTLLNAGIEESKFQNTNILSTGLGTNNMQSFTLDLPLFRIHDWSTKNFQVAVLDLSSINYAYEQMNFAPVIGVLGGDILLKYGAVIDYKRHTLRLQSRSTRLK